MQTELNLFRPNKRSKIPSGVDLRDRGINQAINNADEKHPNWSEKAFSKLREYLFLLPGEFQTEDFRDWATNQGLEEPPSNRAYGGIIVKAKKLNLIKHVGFKSVKNPKAHCTPASVWKGTNQ